MDTGTHVIMGAGLVGLSTLDPALAQNAASFEAVLCGTMIGSVIPDIDTLLKLKDNATYIRHHRGVTHALPATLLWPTFITASLHPFFPEASALHLWLWTCLAVVIHVGTDLFNAYGTQALRPFSNRWIALDMISIFDPFITGAHLAGFVLWYLFGRPGPTFLAVYALLIGYYFLRARHHRRAVNLVKQQIEGLEKIFLSPTMRWHTYHLATIGEHHYYVGIVSGRRIRVIDTFKKAALPDHPAIPVLLSDKNVAAFLSFSPIYRYDFIEYGDYYELRLTDLRYYKSGHYPFVAVARADRRLNLLSSYTGWIYNTEKLERKLVPNVSTSD